MKTLFRIIQCIQHFAIANSQLNGTVTKSFEAKLADLNKFIKPACPTASLAKAWFHMINKRDIFSPHRNNFVSILLFPNLPSYFVSSPCISANTVNILQISNSLAINHLHLIDNTSYPYTRLTVKVLYFVIFESVASLQLWKTVVSKRCYWLHCRIEYQVPLVW